MTPRANEFLEHQLRDMHDTDGTPWRVRIEQGGGIAHLLRDTPPVARLIFRAFGADSRSEVGAAGDHWDLTAYSEIRLQMLLATARADIERLESAAS